MELFDICDEKGQPTGQVIERSLAHASGVMHRTAHIWVVRKGGNGYQVLLQKRSRDKDSFPGCLDTSSAGHIQAGDEPLDSALRELEEELGIHAEAGDLEPIGTFRISFSREFHGKLFVDEEVAFVHLYEKPVDIEHLTLQEEEVEGVYWFDLEEILERRRKNDPRICVPTAGIHLLRDYLIKRDKAE